MSSLSWIKNSLVILVRLESIGICISILRMTKTQRTITLAHKPRNSSFNCFCSTKHISFDLGFTNISGWADIQADCSHCYSTRHVPGGAPPCSASARATLSSPAWIGPHRVPPPPRIFHLSCRWFLPFRIYQGFRRWDQPHSRRHSCTSDARAFRCAPR